MAKMYSILRQKSYKVDEFTTSLPEKLKFLAIETAQIKIPAKLSTI